MNGGIPAIEQVMRTVLPPIEIGKPFLSYCFNFPLLVGSTWSGVPVRVVQERVPLPSL